ncbi:hypothetical protein [Litoribacter populi]|uniref:hypothetical protein n=1 Tax=Litoribacter populi TaxID=2598460 RepID=UPI00117D62AE|nr:hypothetical protein [Litoribacter populi]
MHNYIMNEIDLMRKHGVDFKEYNENSLLIDNEVHFDCQHCFDFVGGKISVCYEKIQKVLLVEYEFKTFQNTHMCLIELNDLTKSWCIIDQSVQHFINVHIGFAGKTGIGDIKVNLNTWKEKAKAEILMVAYKFYFASVKKVGGLKSKV